MTETRPDLEGIRSGLKPFQRATVDHVVDRLWSADDPVDRFLVADEVGLGKTMIAKGVAAHAIDRLWDERERSGDPITIVYICSNRQIARQNLRRLKELTQGETTTNADRLTMLPLSLAGAHRDRLQVISFTPGTSLNFGHAPGRASERALLHWMLSHVLGPDEMRRRSWTTYLAGRMAVENFAGTLAQPDFKPELSPGLIQSFDHYLRTQEGPEGGVLLDELIEHQRRWARTPRRSTEFQWSRYPYIAHLRMAMAHSAVELLNPDLVILDEFQRFKDLFAEDGGRTTDHARRLSRRVISTRGTKSLVLSATPYKMYTLPDDPEGEDHYTDFTATISFLSGRERATEVAHALHELREGILLGTSEGHLRAQRARDRAERGLRRVMSRTERLSATTAGDGMLVESSLGNMRLDQSDLRGWQAVDAVSRVVAGQDSFEYWRAAPYTHNLMERSYKVQQKFLAGAEANHPDVASVLSKHRGALLDWERIRSFKPVDPSNPKLRVLTENLVDHQAWRMAWLCPALPYVEPAGVFANDRAQSFTKRLVFSAWNVVPKTVAALVSYDAERRMVVDTRSRDGNKRTYDSPPTAQALSFGWDTVRNIPRSLPNLTVLYPSPVLARIGDPLEIARTSGKELPLGRERLRGLVEDRVRRLLDKHGMQPQAGADGHRRRWYGIAPMLLDDAVSREEGWTNALSSTIWGERDSNSHLAEHVGWRPTDIAEELGPPPEDLVRVLGLMSVAAPGICALRAMTRGGSIDWTTDPQVREAAVIAARGVRSLFNRQEIVPLVRAASGSGTDDVDSYWNQVLRYCMDGNLQAVLDEYCHMLTESESLRTASAPERAEELADRIAGTASIRTVKNTVLDIRVGEGGVALQSHSVNSHIAARFGRVQTDDAAAEREATVLQAFNSPFWPFVLISTSIGQEGLDFHTYSHAVVHWNLPSNPVDLEQREGRIHRFKGHAVRKNVAAAYGSAVAASGSSDPWEAIFLAAEADRPDGDPMISPYWVFEGDSKIERYVPAMPLSMESRRYDDLRRTLGAYRFVMGQPRQEDLIRYLGPKASELRIDLSPPAHIPRAPSNGAKGSST